MTIIQHDTATAEAPRTILTITAAIDLVAVRIDAASVPASEILAFGWQTLTYGDFPRGVHVQVWTKRGFEALALVFPTLTRRTADGDIYLEGTLPNGTAVQIVTTS